MMKAGKVGILLALMCAALFAVPAAAGAATTTTGSSLASAPVTGVAHNGKKFSGHYTVTDFVTRGGKTYAVGTLTGKLGKRSVNKTVDMPVRVVSSGGGILGAGKVASPAATCPVLHLDLGPLNLNLLGLQVHLNEVILNIDAQSGPGLLLGNLLCGVANLLNTSALPTGQTTGLLNIVQSLLGSPSLLGL
jgi:hypothetical protein